MSNPLKAERYEMLRELGRGGMGVVWQARDTRLGRDVALKMLPADLTSDRHLRHRLATEARAASSLSHPGVATVFDFIEHEGECFIVFELVEGVTLRAWMRGTRPKTEQVLDIGIRIADALVAAHARGIVHRDLKPGNVMLAETAEGRLRVKVLDFGLAKFERSALPAADSVQTETVVSHSGSRVGTIHYMAPEQLEGETVDARADIHALGLILYEMAGGVHPFAGRTPESTIANILRSEPAPLAGKSVLSAELDRIVRKCLRKRREERYPSAADLLADLSSLRRELTSGQVSAPAAIVTSDDEQRGSMAFARNPARLVFGVIQLGYMSLYLGLLLKQDTALEALVALLGIGQVPTRWSFPGLAIQVMTMSAVIGLLVRMYLISAVAADYPNLGRNFRKMFPTLLVFDLAWALSPLLLHRKLNFGIVMACVAALAYLPFVQRRLIYDAYSAGGGRTSGTQHAIAE